MSGHAAGKAQALTEPMPAASNQLPARAKPNSGLIGTFHGTALSADTLEFMFADGRAATAEVRNFTHDQDGAVRTWTGEFVDSPGSVLTLTRTRGVIAGFANYEGRAFELLPAPDGRHILFEVDGERLPQGDVFQSNHAEARRVLRAGADIAAGADGSVDATVMDGSTAATTTASVTVHDVLIYYTAASATAWGQSALESMVHSAVQSANLAYANSQARVALNVVGLQRSPVNEGGSMSATVDALKGNSTARAARDSLGADLVMVISQNADVCGFATLWYSWSGSTTNWDAYGGVHAGCLSGLALGHEAAHLQQLDHNKEDATGFGPYAYSYGYRVCTTGGFRDIMSYPCSMSVPSVNYFSNPNLTYNGYALGNSQSADGARSLNETAATVAAYRVGKSTSISPPPAAPTSLASTSVKYDRVAMSWNDNSSNESGFKVQRSTDGVNYAVIATLGSNTGSFVDTGVAPQTSYTYRVAAYNSAGSSGYSNVLSVKTKGLPPAAPGSVAAANGGNGSAIVTWVDKSANETRFDIRRAKWDTATKKWLPRVSLGSVGANVTRFVDWPGKGTYRYYVRAANSYGVSAFASSSTVTVTGG